MPRKYRMKADSTVDPSVTAGTVVYGCTKPDYGLSKDDSRMLGFPCQSVSLKEDGDYPFIVVPCHDLESLPHNVGEGEV